MNIRDRQFLTFTRKLQLTPRQREWLDRQKKEMDEADERVRAYMPTLLAECRAKREAGESLSAWIDRQTQYIAKRKGEDIRDHDKEYAKETGEDLDVNRSQSSGDKSWIP